MSIKSVLTAAATVVFSACAASASPVAWTVGSGGNGHSYEVVIAAGGIDWNDAKIAAEGLGGYLATIESASENDFVHALTLISGAWYVDCCNSFGPWIGGIQAAGSPEPAGGFGWVTGEAWSYTNWASSEPSNAFAGGSRPEEAVHYFGYGGNNFAKTWNDFPRDEAFYTRSYVVEYDAVPLPASVAFLGLAVGALAWLGARRTKQPG